MPQEEAQWGANANCYAYACDCERPLRAIKGAVPGARAGSPVLLMPDLQAYSKQLILGAIADAKVQGKQVSIVYALPGKPPADSPGTYLVALLVGAGGFHWLRRDPRSGRWSWKDGNGQTVKYNIFDHSKNKWVYIDDKNLGALLVTRKGQFVPWVYGGMQFVAFLRMPADGIDVRGPE